MDEKEKPIPLLESDLIKHDPLTGEPMIEAVRLWLYVADGQPARETWFSFAPTTLSDIHDGEETKGVTLVLATLKPDDVCPLVMIPEDKIDVVIRLLQEARTMISRGDELHQVYPGGPVSRGDG